MDLSGQENTGPSPDQSKDYDVVKDLILKAYELVPEAYRVKFRTTYKQEKKSHVEYAKTKEDQLDLWVQFKNIGGDFEKFKQVILLEDFKRCIRKDISVHLDERKIETLAEGAVLADEYALTH
ncbi:hypothetical protein Pcinc_000620 [Petrolisthes cinctipes]|uniref:SCAN box domain-containing protein n=1 Tax=Petrolisthes cinctipes TaxID=88211 RepID=A0AAE1GP94_PETCI|nr:hypothetical protein Pcinc_000620 [Petrolisthes cinctipes]